MENTNNTDVNNQVNAETLDDAALDALTRPDDQQVTDQKASGGNGRKGRNNGKASDTIDAKPIKYSLPFVAVIFNRPNRDVQPIVKKTRKGVPTGVITRLVAEVTLPLIGHVLTIKGSIWENTRYSRESGQFQREYDLSVGDRFNMIVPDAALPSFNEWKRTIIGPGGHFDKWLESPESKINTARATDPNMAPRLVKTVAAKNDDPAVQEYERLIAAARNSA